jgi:hypothetical protein
LLVALVEVVVIILQVDGMLAVGVPVAIENLQVLLQVVIQEVH